MTEVITKNEFGLFYDTSILEDGVEFIGLINKQGKMENTLFKNEINLTKERKEMFSMAHRLQSSMQKDFDYEFGSIHYTIIERENARFVSMPTHAGILLTKLKKSVDPFAFVNKITAMMNPSKVLFEVVKCAYLPDKEWT
ncbi:MAG: hypothetical protein ACYC6W_06360 [Nitrosotalea sp.]